MSCKNSYGLLRENRYIHTQIYIQCIFSFRWIIFSQKLLKSFLPNSVSLYEVKCFIDIYASYNVLPALFF